MNSQSPGPFLSQTPSLSSRRGGTCFLRGCLVLVIVAMLFGVLLGGCSWYIYHSLRPFLTHSPVAVRTFQGGEAAFAATESKLKAFNESLAAGQPATLSLTADDLNALLAHTPELADFRDHVFISIVNNQLMVELSRPIADDSNLRPGDRVFFNARAIFDASFSTGDFACLLERLEALAGQQPSPFFLSFAKWYFSVASQGFNRSFHEHPEKYGALPQFTAQVRTVIIQHNQIEVTSVEHPTAPALPAATPVATPAEAP